MSVEIIPSAQMSHHDAERLTHRITLMAGTIREGVEKLHSLVQQAKEGGAHIALGYPSWTAYLADTLGKTPIQLPREERREIVGYLAGEGMSTRAIAPIVGVSQSSVRDDLKVSSNYSPAEIIAQTGEAHLDAAETAARGEGDSTPANVVRHIDRLADDLPPFDPATGEVLDEPEPEKVTGLDGKTYTRPTPRETKPRRTSLPDTFFNVTVDLTKKVDSLTRLVEDDRFPQNAEKVATANRSDLLRAIDALQRIADQLPTPEGERHV